MKAYQIKQPATLAELKPTELPDPGAPRAGEVRVRIHASSLNYHDLGVVAGKLPVADGRIPMADASGIVEAIGENVSEFSVGDHVISHFFPGWDDGAPPVGNFSISPGDGFDGYAREIVVAPANWFTHAPAGWSHVAAATVPIAAVTAWRALVEEGGLRAGQTVLVLGSGGVSVFGLQIAKAMGARVVATSSSPEKLERLRGLGADHTIDYRAQPEWGEAVRRWTEDRGVDHVLEVGGPGTFPQSVAAVRVGGHVSMIGVLTGVHGDVSLGTITMKQIKLQGIVVGSRQHQRNAVRAIEAIGLQPQIDRVFPFDALREAFQHQVAGAHFGKIAITY